MYEITNINGVTFIYSPFKGIQTASLGVFLRIGSRFEERRLKGAAHFLEHMLFKGTRSYSCSQIKREIEGRGGSLNAFTSKEITGCYAHFLNKNLGLTLDILLDMVFNPLLKKDDMNRERKVVLEEIKMCNDLPHSRAVTLLDQLLWRRHPLGEEVIGYVSTIKNMKALDLDIFRNKYYRPSNMIISFSGDFAKDKIINLLKNKIKKMQVSAKIKAITPSSCKDLQIKCEKKLLEQSHLCFGFRSVSYLSPDRLIVQLINVILGANMSSRLFEELREKRSLCYDISTEVKEYKDSGAFLIHIGLDESKIKVAAHFILRELSRIKEKKVSIKELSRAKDYSLGQIAMSLERPQGRMFYLAENYITQGKIYTFKDIKKKIDSITPLQIKRVTKDVFKFESMCISCVGNIKDDLEKEIRRLSLAENFQKAKKKH